MAKQALVLCNELKAKYPHVIALAILSGPLASQGKPERSAQLLGASDILLKTMGLRLQPSDQAEIDRFQVIVRQQLGEGGYKNYWSMGQKMTLEQATLFALQR